GPGGTTRIDAGSEQRFAGVDVADAHHHGVVHDERLDRHAAPARQAEQSIAVELVTERLRPEAGEQRMIERIGTPEQRPEAAWVGVAQGHARLQQDIDVLVLFRRKLAIHQPQAAGHAQMRDQRTRLRLDQQVLGAPLDRLDTLAGQAHVQVFRNRPAQAPLTHDHTADTLADEMRLDTAAGGFDFGKFRHGGIRGTTERAEILAWAERRREVTAAGYPTPISRMLSLSETKSYSDSPTYSSTSWAIACHS